MINSEHGKKKISTFHKGTDYDVHPELSELREGHYIDANNMSIRTDNGLDYSLQKIKGETPLYNVYNGKKYQCTGTCYVNFHIVNIWVAEIGTTASTPAIIEVDGVVMMSTDQVDWDINHPFQIDINDSCNGGEFAITDFKNLPYIFSVQDIIDNYNAGTGVYFALFNPSLYTVQLDLPLDHPIFIQLENKGGTSGLPVGEYSYSIRYADSTGNRTGWSIQTPYIPVPKRDTNEASRYYKNYTKGGATDILVPTMYGIRLRFRVNNQSNYEYIEIRRIKQNTGQALNYMATPQKLVLVNDASGNAVDIRVNKFDVLEFVDYDGLKNDWEDILDEDAAEQPSAFEAAKAIRYYQQRLVLMNIKYPSKDLSDKLQFLTINGELGFPTTDNIGNSGFSDMWNQTYRKSLQSGEKYGWGIEVLDEQGGRTFVVPYTTLSDDSLKNYQMPNRRDEMTGNSYDWSVNKGTGAVTAINTENNLSKTFEVFDMEDADYKRDFSTVISIEDGSYNPLTPVNSEDTSVTGLDYRVNTTVGKNYTGTDIVTYRPKGFNPRYFANGMTFAGINPASFPSWGKSFSIVRTKRAGRVIAQGIGVYKIVGSDGSSIADKKMDTFTCFFPDLANAFTPTQISAISNYKIQLVSPLGFFSECFSGDPLAAWSDGVDLISYARLLHNISDNGLNNINPELYDWNDNNDYYTKFGIWRNDPNAPNPFGSPVDGNLEFDIDTFTAITQNRSNFYEIKLNTPIYTHGSAGAFRGGAATNAAKNFHEPFYIINIIDDGKDVADGNIVEYVQTGHYQKLSSIIGYGTTQPQSILLVDERWEDCIPNYNFAGVSTLDSYIYVDGKRWLNIQHKLPIDLTPILLGLQANGHYTFTDSNNEVVTIYGVYGYHITGRDYYIDFTSPSPTFNSIYFLPAQGAEIVVKYDQHQPIRVYGGDITVGECVFAPIDETTANGVKLFAPLPYSTFYMNTNYNQMRNGDGANPIFNDYAVKMDILRQWLIMFTCESITNLPLRYAIDSKDGDITDPAAGTYSSYSCFPLINYVQRPHSYNATLADNFALNGGNVDNQYLVDFPQEHSQWEYGGFKFIQPANTDYAKELNDSNGYSKPKVGFTEKTTFCSRVIWSQTRAINEQNDPNLKTFPSLNIFDISDAMQEIKFAYDDNTVKGNNLYAITGKGVCLLITDKRILSDITGSELAYLSPDTNFIGGQYWLSKVIGMNDEMWRSAAEYDNQLFFANNESVYKFEELKLTDILRENTGSYYTKLYPYLRNILSGYQTPVCAVYDRNHEEYWLHIGQTRTTVNFTNYLNLGEVVTGDYYLVQPDQALVVVNPNKQNIIYLPKTTFATGEVFYMQNNCVTAAQLIGVNGTSVNFNVGSSIKLTKDTTPYGWTITNSNPIGKTFMYINPEEKKCWAGTNDHTYDKMLCCTKIDGLSDLRVVGMKDMLTYKTDSGYTLNGNHIPVDAFVTFAISPSLGNTKEFIDFVANTNTKPTEVEFAESLAALPECSVVAVNIRDMRGNYYSFIPRKTAGLRDRLQNDVCFIKVKHNLAEDFNIVNFTTSYKLLK